MTRDTERRGQSWVALRHPTTTTTTKKKKRPCRRPDNIDTVPTVWYCRHTVHRLHFYNANHRDKSVHLVDLSRHIFHEYTVPWHTGRDVIHMLLPRRLRYIPSSTCRLVVIVDEAVVLVRRCLVRRRCCHGATTLMMTTTVLIPSATPRHSIRAGSCCATTERHTISPMHNPRPSSRLVHRRAWQKWQRHWQTMPHNRPPSSTCLPPRLDYCQTVRPTRRGIVKTSPRRPPGEPNLPRIVGHDGTIRQMAMMMKKMMMIIIIAVMKDWILSRILLLWRLRLRRRWPWVPPSKDLSHEKACDCRRDRDYCTLS
mmetsp:Transcript_18079/g.36437  ORF Transcript_18079/g.36437 Transcript_18079/m.36437 type:complete len:312 (-) Transcript_18079:251-1186(-)